MPEIAIITDSLASIPVEVSRQYDITVLPQLLIWDDITLLDGVDLTPSEFYERLSKSSTLPTTSQITIGMFHAAFEPFVRAGRPILAVVLSSEISGTMQSALQAREMFPEAEITVVDSRMASMGLGFQVLAAARAVQNGADYRQVVELTQQAHATVGLYAIVETLEFLHRGGRIGGAARFLGTALNLKPILTLSNGRVEPIDRVRTLSKAIQRVGEMLAAELEGRSNVRLAALHANSPSNGEALLNAVCAHCDPVETYLTDVSPVLGIHLGPGAVGICYAFDQTR